MIAMQYTIRLAADYHGDQVHQRVNQRRSLFDDLPGLLHKSFLFNESEGLYAPFYVWEDDAPARAFLMGDLFRDLVDTFGRPRVRCWSVISFRDRPGLDAGDIAVKELDSIAAETSHRDPTDAQKLELDRRLTELDAIPENVLTWEQIKARVKDRR